MRNFIQTIIFIRRKPFFYALKKEMVLISCGIYSITNKTNGRRYIGQSIKIEQRWKEHINSLNKGSHHSDHLQRSWNKYGAESFLFEIIEFCVKKELTEKEKYWIDYYNSLNENYGYNMRGAGNSGHYSEYTLRKMSEVQKGKWVGENNSAAMITDNQARIIINKLANGKRVREISDETGVSSRTIYHIKLKEHWTHLSKGIEFPCLYSSKYIGVSYDKGYGKWAASLNYKKRRVYLAFFDNEIEAAKSRDEQAKIFFGNKARLNFK